MGSGAAASEETFLVRKKASKGDRLGRLCVANEVCPPPPMRQRGRRHPTSHILP